MQHRSAGPHIIWQIVLGVALVALVANTVCWVPHDAVVATASTVLAALILYVLVTRRWGWPVLLWTLLVAALGVVPVITYLLLRPQFGRRAVLWTVVLTVAIPLVACALCASMPGVYGMVLMMIGGAQLLAVLYFWPRRAFRQPRITREMLEPVARERRGGATLISVLVAMAIIAMCLTMALQAYVGGSRFVALESQRAGALAACQMQIESARAQGYGRLPEAGEHGFEVGPGVAGEGRIVVAPGPISESRRVTARVSWPAGERMPAGRVELVTIMTPRGIGG